MNSDIDKNIGAAMVEAAAQAAATLGLMEAGEAARALSSGSLSSLNESIDTMMASTPMRLYGFMANRRPLQVLAESTLDRVVNYHGENGMVIISSDRGSRGAMGNYVTRKGLIEDIRSRGYSYFTVYGGFRELDGHYGNYETSFVIPSKKPDGSIVPMDELRNFAIEMCGKYDQDCVLIKEPGKKPEYVDREGKPFTEYGVFTDDPPAKNDLSKQAFTSMIKTKHPDEAHPERLKRFSYIMEPEKKDENYGLFMNPPPETGAERALRSNGGEIFARDEDK